MLSKGVSALETSSSMIWGDGLRSGVPGGLEEGGAPQESGLGFLAWWGQGACPSLSNRLEWSCLLFLLLSRTGHLLAAPSDPQPWPGTVGLFGEGDPDAPSCCLSAALALSDSLYPQLSLKSSGSPELCCSPFLRQLHHLC